MTIALKIGDEFCWRAFLAETYRGSRPYTRYIAVFKQRTFLHTVIPLEPHLQRRHSFLANIVSLVGRTSMIRDVHIRLVSRLITNWSRSLDIVDGVGFWERSYTLYWTRPDYHQQPNVPGNVHARIVLVRVIFTKQYSRECFQLTLLRLI